MEIRRVNEAVTGAESRLHGSTFEKVDLSGARLDEVKMVGATMSRVDLSGLSLTRCDLRNTTIRACRTEGMTIDGIPLRDLLACYGAEPRHATMPRRRRKLIGVAVTIVFVVVYALVAMALSQIRFQPGPPSVWQWLFYAVVGMGWIVPLMPLIRWMERPDDGPQ